MTIRSVFQNPITFDGEKCVLLLCAWKPAFLKSGHICISSAAVHIQCSYSIAP